MFQVLDGSKLNTWLSFTTLHGLNKPLVCSIWHQRADICHELLEIVAKVKKTINIRPLRNDTLGRLRGLDKLSTTMRCIDKKGGRLTEGWDINPKTFALRKPRK